jgi:hypothetical protein
MSASIYYAARHEQPLSPDERATVDRLIAKYSIREQVEQYVMTGRGHNGENFHLYDPNQPTHPGVIFEGATKLPDNSEDALWELTQLVPPLVRGATCAAVGFVGGARGRSRHGMG